MNDNKTKKCPFCKKEVDSEASICPYCKSDLTVTGNVGSVISNIGKIIMLLVGLGIIIFLLYMCTSW